MAIPVSVVLDRGGLGPFDLSGMVAEGSLTWSSVVPGGYASCSFTVQGDFRTILKQIPYLSTLRVLGDSGRILWEGQIEDLSPTVSEGELGVKVGAFGLQNALKETTVRTVWSKRDMGWTDPSLPVGSADASGAFARSSSIDILTGNFDPTDPVKSGVQASGTAAAVLNHNGNWAEWIAPIGVTLRNVRFDLIVSGTDAGTAKFELTVYALEGGSWVLKTSSTASANGVSTALASATALRFGANNESGATVTPAATDRVQVWNIRVASITIAEDVAGGFYGDTLIRSLLTNYATKLGPGVIESGSDFFLDHLDASVRRTAYDILQEIAGYYSREWAVWENALLDWRTPQLSQPQWIIPIAQLSSLDLDASVQNSKKTSYVLYTDAASGLTGEASVAATDRRNPYVLNGRAKDEISPAELTMTSNTAAQLAKIILNDLGFGPVPAAGSISLPGDTIVQHAQGNAVKAWEIRSGDNVTIPELPMADVFTQDGRGEALFHIVSAEAETGAGLVTLTLDSYGSKRSDVLIARLAAVTAALGG